MEICSASKNHLNEVYNLICELENKQLNKEEFSKIFSDNLQDKNISYLVALDNEKAVGFISMHLQNLLHHVSRIAEIQELVVSKEVQGSGIGSLLFNKIKEIALEKECSQIEVCCNKIREKSHQFYLKQNMKNNHYKFSLKIENSRK